MSSVGFVNKYFNPNDFSNSSIRALAIEHNKYLNECNKKTQRTYYYDSPSIPVYSNTYIGFVGFGPGKTGLIG